jgi:hypothetical protein
MIEAEAELVKEGGNRGAEATEFAVGGVENKELLSGNFSSAEK